MIIWVIIITIIVVIVGFIMKNGIEINLEKRYNLMLWQVIVLFTLGIAVGLWLPW